MYQTDMKRGVLIESLVADLDLATSPRQPLNITFEMEEERIRRITNVHVHRVDRANAHPAQPAFGGAAATAETLGLYGPVAHPVAADLQPHPQQ